MNILYLGQSGKASTSYHRAKALERIGHTVTIANPYEILDDLGNLISKLHYKTGYRFLQKKVQNWINTSIPKNDIDLVWINSGELFGLKNIKLLKTKFKKPILLYNNDDPTGGRDGNRFNMLLTAIPEYDMCVVMRELNVDEYYKKGAKKVIRVFMSYDEIEHAPLPKSSIEEKFKSEVSFIGTNIPGDNRDKFLLTLIEKGIPISIWGARWERSQYWQQLKPFFRGNSLKGKDYIAAIQGSKICIGLLSKGNRDLHTTRTFEIPFVGSLFCAERTSEHADLFKENEEAVFWTNAEECAEKCRNLLNNEELINKISQNGRAKITQTKRGNEDVVRHILKSIN